MNILFSKLVFILRIVECGISDMQGIKEHLDIMLIFAIRSVRLGCEINSILTEGTNGSRSGGDDLRRYTNERPAMGGCATSGLKLGKMRGIWKHCARQILWVDILRKCYKMKTMKGKKRNLAH
jgi:hypothetical protein